LLNRDATQREGASSELAPEGASFALPARENGGRWTLALTLSLAVHAALGVWAISHFVRAPGGQGVQLEGIEVSIVSAAVLESLRASSEVGGGSTGPLAEMAGQASERDAVAPQTPAVPPPELPVITILTARDADAPLIAPADPEKPAEPKPRATEVAALAVVQPETAASQAGGAVVEAAVPSVAQAAARQAAPGAVMRYAADVRQALNKSRRQSGWPVGKLRLTFQVLDDGHVANASIAEGSGNIRLDKLALTWIETAKLPVPPVGLVLAQRTYDLPMSFK
jgi:TonB family protein